LSHLCTIKIGPLETIRKKAIKYKEAANLSTNDAIHLACAMNASADYFFTCDDELIKRSAKLNLSICVINPVDYYREVIQNE